MKLISPQSDTEWAQYYRCRWETLRAPWGRPEGSERAEDDGESDHVMAVDNGKVCGVARMHFSSPGITQVRYMGVDKDSRRKGVGRELLAYLEDLAKKKGSRQMILHARDTAIQFYEESGYEIVEKSYLLFGEIQHYLMQKQLD